MSEIEKKIREIINNNLSEDIFKDAYEIIKDENLFNLGLDSLNIVKFMIAIEDEYNISFCSFINICWRIFWIWIFKFSKFWYIIHILHSPFKFYFLLIAL